MRGIVRGDRFGIVRPELDAHTLGIEGFVALLDDCGLACAMAPGPVRTAALRPEAPESRDAIAGWVRSERISALGFSWRLDPETGVDYLDRFIRALGETGILAAAGGPVRAVYFAGLPLACGLALERCPSLDAAFQGDETPAEILETLGLPRSLLPGHAARGAVYDEARMSSRGMSFPATGTCGSSRWTAPAARVSASGETASPRVSPTAPRAASRPSSGRTSARSSTTARRRSACSRNGRGRWRAGPPGRALDRHVPALPVPIR